jgi:hypothetical protein
LESAVVVVACGGKNVPARSSSVRRRAISEPRSGSATVRSDKSGSFVDRVGIRHPSAVRSLAWQVFDYATYFNSKENLVPESRTRKSAEEKQKLKAQQASKPKKIKAPASRRWVPPAFITVGLLGVAWLITYYVAGTYIPFMDALGNWNILIGMGGMAAAFVIATLWR